MGRVVEENEDLENTANFVRQKLVNKLKNAIGEDFKDTQVNTYIDAIL